MEPADWRAQWLFFLIFSFLFYSSSFSSLLSLSLSFCLSTQNHSNNNNKELGKQQKWQHKGEKIIKSTQRKKYLIKNTHTLSLSLFLSQPKITTKKKKKSPRTSVPITYPIRISPKCRLIWCTQLASQILESVKKENIVGNRWRKEERTGKERIGEQVYKEAKKMK